MLFNEDLNKDYRLNGFHKKETFDSKGDLITVEYYSAYDGTAYAGLQVKETRTYSRAATGLLSTRDMTINWYDGLNNIIGTKTTKKYYDANKGILSNVRARQNLTAKAKAYTYNELLTTDAVNGEANAKEFLRDLRTEIVGYENGDRQPLLDGISNSTRTYITGTIKTTLAAILNISY